ncbi:MAG: MFS transporter, partial [Clostridia bacterium]|nr:MFS transporter [Clostridia bacterium]
IYQGYASKFFESAGMNTAQLSVILAATQVISIFAQPLWGAAGDRAKSRNQVLRLLILIAAAVVLLYRVSGAFLWLLPVSCLFSAAYTSIQPMGDSIILEALTPDNHPFGPIRLMGCLSFAVMNLLWGQFLAPERMNFVVYATSILLVILLFVARVLPVTAGHQAATGRKMNMTAILKLKHMPGLFTLMMLLQLTMGYFYSFFSIHFTALPGGTNGLLGLCYFLSAASEVPFLLNADRLYKKLGVGKLMSISALVVTLRWILLASTGSAYAALASQLLHGGGFIVMTVSMSKFINDTIPDELKASGQMLIAVVGFGIARAFGILGGGLVASVMGSIQMGFALMAAISGVALIAFAPKYLRMKPLNGEDKA